MSQPRPRYFELLDLLSRHRVDFIVVGGVAAILEGVPMTTLDLDVVCDRSPDNLGRLLGALRSIDAIYRDPAGRRIEPTLEKLITIEVNLFRTSLGAFDVLASIGGDGYEDLLVSANTREVGDLRIRVLGLAKIIESKEQANRDKDKAMLPVMHRTLELRLRRKQDS